MKEIFNMPQTNQLVDLTINTPTANSRDLALIDEMAKLTEALLAKRRGDTDKNKDIKEKLSDVLVSCDVLRRTLVIERNDLEKQAAWKLGKYRKPKVRSDNESYCLEPFPPQKEDLKFGGIRFALVTDLSISPFNRVTMYDTEEEAIAGLKESYEHNYKNDKKACEPADIIGWISDDGWEAKITYPSADNAVYSFKIITVRREADIPVGEN